MEANLIAIGCMPLSAGRKHEIEFLHDFIELVYLAP